MALRITLALFGFTFIFGTNIFPVESLGLKINKIADRALPSVKKVTKQIGFDPMNVPAVSDDLSLATINLTDGTLLGATQFKRNENVVVSVLPGLIPTVRINASLYFPQLRAKFNYSLSAFVYTDTGSLDALIDNITAHVTLDYRVLGLTLTNPTFKIDHFGDVTVDMASDSYINWLQNIIADSAIPFYKDHIATISEETVNQLTEKSIKFFNKNRFKFAISTVLDVVTKKLGLKK